MKAQLLMVASFIFTIGVYSFSFPWQVALGMVILLAIHEAGHLWAGKQKKIPMTLPIFIPYVGALISLKEKPSHAEDEAYLAIGGPLLGSIGTLLFFLWAMAADEPMLYVITLSGIVLNTLNLVPMHPLDGGRIVTAITRWLWLLGVVGGGYLFVWVLHSWLFSIVWGIFVMQLLYQYGWKKKKKVWEEETEERNVTIPPAFWEDIERGYLPFRFYSHLEDGCSYVELLSQKGEVMTLLPVPSYMGVTNVYSEKQPVVQGIYSIELDYISLSKIDKSTYYYLSLKRRLQFAAAYLMLLAFLLGMGYVTFQAMLPYEQAIEQMLQ